jgi:uncharacterized protein YggE
VKAAREKAGDLAKALGQEIGKAQSIEEVPDNQAAGLQSNNYYDYRGRDKTVAPTIAVGQKSISASVMVSFELN